MVQIGRRGTTRCLSEDLKNSQKSQNSNFKILVHHFFASVSPVYCKKNRLDLNKIDGGHRFWSLPLWRFRQWHCCSSKTLGGIFWLNRRHGGVQRSKLGDIPNWEHLELGAQSSCKNQPAWLTVCDSGETPPGTWFVHVHTTGALWRTRFSYDGNVLSLHAQSWANIISSTKLQVHNLLHCHQSTTEPWSQLTCTENFVKFGQVVFETYE